MSSGGGAVENYIGADSDGASWEWVRWETRTLAPFVSFYYRSKIWNKIKARLKQVGNDALLDRFASGCFGHLLEWRENQCSGHATHAVVARQIILQGAANHELWFRVLGQNVKFSFREYALVTGLRFGPTDFNPNGWHDTRNVGVHYRFFGDEKTTVGELLDMFQFGVARATHDDYLKVANLLALYMFGLGYDSSKVIEDFAWVLVDDLEAWNRFPWGAYTYQALMHYVYRVGRTKEECGDRYHFFGPVWALQIWAYEAIPDLARAAAEADRPDALPRCLRWKFIKPKVKNFRDYFNREIKRSCLQTLTPEANEVQQEYWKSVNGPDPMGVSYIEPFNEATARIRIDGPLRKSKLIERRKQFSKIREGELQEQRTAYIEQCWEKRERKVILNIETNFIKLFKETMHTEMKKVIFSAWCCSSGASSSDLVSSLPRISPIPLEHTSVCFSQQEQETSNYNGEEVESEPEDTLPVPPRCSTRTAIAENTRVVRRTDRAKQPTTRSAKVGDPVQLPPTVVSTVADEYGYGMNLFKRFQKAVYPVQMVKTQYCMNPEIRSFFDMEEGPDVEGQTVHGTISAALDHFASLIYTKRRSPNHREVVLGYPSHMLTSSARRASRVHETKVKEPLHEK